jgi:hypothetical protein
MKRFFEGVTFGLGVGLGMAFFNTSIWAVFALFAVIIQKH